MDPATLAKAERLLSAGTPVAAVCGVLNITRKTLERAFHETHGIPPARWSRLRRGAAPRSTRPDVVFRLQADEAAELQRRADAHQVSPSEYARRIVRTALTHLKAYDTDEG